MFGLKIMFFALCAKRAYAELIHLKKQWLFTICKVDSAAGRVAREEKLTKNQCEHLPPKYTRSKKTRFSWLAALRHQKLFL